MNTEKNHKWGDQYFTAEEIDRLQELCATDPGFKEYFYGQIGYSVGINYRMTGTQENSPVHEYVSI
jgi:hypothetical protein